MGLFDTAPEIAVLVPEAVFAGEVTTVGVVLEAEAAVEVEHVEATVRAVQGWAAEVGPDEESVRHEATPLVLRLMGQGVVPKGQTHLAVAFTLPRETPPSHAIGGAFAGVYFDVHVGIRWWPDARRRIELPVRPAAIAAVEPVPATAASGGPLAPASPRIELALASTRLIAGGPVIGSCAVFHLDDRRPRDLELAVRPRLRLFHRGRERVRAASPHVFRLELPAGSAGKAVPVQLALPPALTPSFAAHTHALEWELVARTSGTLLEPRVEVAIPITIADRRAHATTATAATLPPPLADQQIVAAFTELARRRGWRVAIAAGGAPYVEHALDDAAAVRIAYAYRGARGAFVVARLAYPSLGLGLVVEPESALRNLLFHDIEAGLATWDRNHHVRARSEAQTAPFLRQVTPAAAAGLGSLLRWDDDAIELEYPVGAVSADGLEILAARLVALADAIAAARDAIAPPPELAVDRAAWRALASWLDGRLTMGNLSLDGALDGVPVQIGLDWSTGGEPAALRVRVGGPSHAAAAVRAISLELAAPAAQAATAPGAAAIAAVIAGWRDDVVELRIADGVASAAWRLPADRIVDATRVRELVGGLRAVLAALDPETGPYR